MNDKIINSVDNTNNIDHIDKNEANLKKAIKTIPISTMDKIDLDNKVTYSIKSLDKKIHDKVSKKINNNELSKNQEAKLDWVALNIANKSNELISDMIFSLDQSFPNEAFEDLKNSWIKELSNVLDGIKFYDKVKIKELSETEKLMANNDNWWVAASLRKHWSFGWMFMSVFKN